MGGCANSDYVSQVLTERCISLTLNYPAGNYDANNSPDFLSQLFGQVKSSQNNNGSSKIKWKGFLSDVDKGHAFWYQG